MKKKFIFFIFLIVTFLNSYAEGPVLLDMRNQLFDEANQIKTLLVRSNEPAILINMWNSCMTTIIQLNAYFYMLSIFDAIKTDFLKDDPTVYITMWLREMKKTNELNIKNLTDTKALEPEVKTYIEKLKKYFSELGKLLDVEIDKITVVRKTLVIKKRSSL
ncbi:MAG: hypothetical protein NC935_04430 [Candidatus Omnitrophica bacterium]|nr:hypothetical protein [Candidatus Omnitrophota bacterium]